MAIVLEFHSYYKIKKIIICTGNNGSMDKSGLFLIQSIIIMKRKINLFVLTGTFLKMYKLKENLNGISQSTLIPTIFTVSHKVQ